MAEQEEAVRLEKRKGMAAAVSVALNRDPQKCVRTKEFSKLSERRKLEENTLGYWNSWGFWGVGFFFYQISKA